ncbi:MAG TPA: Flp family type IVb pilin [Acidimicrobiales bacterium]|nr:Flp family type IVb pilin [Acidimicrobiales bacterium]
MASGLEMLCVWMRVRFGDRDHGASLVEYALLLALIAVVCIAAISFLGSTASTSFTRDANSLSN